MSLDPNDSDFAYDARAIGHSKYAISAGLYEDVLAFGEWLDIEGISSWLELSREFGTGNALIEVLERN